jgi:hypothetical protein
MLVTKEIIEKVNKESPDNQGIFTEPYCIPTHIKEPVIYSRYEIGGYSGGSCWDDSDPRPYTSEPPANKMEVLEILLKYVKPDISFLQFRQLVSRYLKTNQETEHEYYGNSTEWEVEYILISDFENYINSIT